MMASLQGRRLVMMKWTAPFWRVWNSTTAYNAESLTISVQNGLPTLSVPLPSKRESCDFALRPHLHSVGDFIQHLKAEDMGVEHVGVYSPQGNRISKSTGLDILLNGDFDLRINDFKYRVQVPQDVKYGLIGEESLADVKNLVYKIFSTLNVDRHQLFKERELRGELEKLEADLAPLESEKKEIERTSYSYSNLWMWGCFAYLSFQFGFFARLTWWEYSWDIMEPVTYFFTFGTSMVMFAYFVVTRQEFIYPEAKDRVLLNRFYKIAKKKNFDVSRYNHLKDAIQDTKEQLRRLHDPLQLNLPTPPPLPQEHKQQ